MTRQQMRHENFVREFKRVKEEHGSGTYSWAEGMTRKAARRIARRRSKGQKA